MSTGCWRSGIFANEEERQEKFYSVYRDLFHQLAAEEYAYIEDPEERNYPVFGTFTSDYETVQNLILNFYNLYFSGCGPILRLLAEFQHSPFIRLAGQMEYARGTGSTNGTIYGKGESQESRTRTKAEER